MNTNILKTAIAALALLVVFNSCKKEETKFHIEVTCDPERGTVTGTGDYAEGSKATIIATPNEGYCFAKWEGYSSTDSIITVNVSADKTYTAIFGKADIIQKFQNGYMKSSETIDGRTITYEAVPDENCYFLKWSNGERNPIIVTQEAISDLTPIFKPFPEGSIHAVFFVSETKRVIFSKGNLQFNPTLGSHTRADGTTAPGTWRFAEKQTDYDIKGDSIVSATYDGWIDNFAWGTSGWSGSGATYYQPYEGKINGDVLDNPEGFSERHPNLNVYDENQFGPQGECDLTGEYAYADWGVYNPISNGGNKPGMWRTLKADEYNFFYNKYNSYSLQGCSWYYNGEDPISEQAIDEYRDGKYDNFYKEIDANNQIVFFYNYLGWEMWSASGREDGMARLNIRFVYERCLRFRVRLVMDVDE
ncbi:MAG: hypothetical protein IKZ99_02515 [Salinivirgaceae bacterium]|nr:hypothetical protein [Salinivirgaceae bacterium]